MDLFAKLKTMALLLIDDDEWVRNSLQLFFESEGCIIDALETAEDGLKLSQSKNFDIIISDYRLPGIDGCEFIKRLPPKQAESIKVLITSYGNDKLRKKAFEAGFHEIIAKPFSSEDIEECLQRLLIKVV